jgi:hypothetical protein
MANVYAAVGIAKCPKTGQMYGVRMEERRKNKWVATWAFPIKAEIAQREGYAETEFPAQITYDEEYPGCPYCKKREDLAAISIKPKREIAIRVGASSSYDDLGSVLSSMEIPWKPFQDFNDCDVLFLNCLGSAPDADKLRRFVEKGGCVFGSCTQIGLLSQAFPEAVQYTDIGYKTGTETVTIEDSDLRKFIGKDHIKINFHVAGKGNPNGGNFTTILKGCGDLFDYGTNICIKAKCGKGSIFFTMFHNSDNQNEQEKALLKLLVLKEIGESRNLSLSETGENLGVDMDRIKAQFRTNY